jgi:hypothetical protein
MQKTLTTLLFPFLLSACAQDSKSNLENFNFQVSKTIDKFFDEQPNILYKDSTAVIYDLPLVFSLNEKNLISLGVRYFDNIPVGKSCNDYLEFRAFKYNISNPINDSIMINQVWLCEFKP